MAALAPSVAAIRSAIRRTLGELDRDALVLVACSGGADSLALAAATAFVAPRLGLRAGLLTVDHGLQPGSAQRAVDLLEQAEKMSLAPAVGVTVDATPRGDGPEAAARDARYAGLAEAATRLGATAVLLGHTREDQAETVLLALTRGAGPRGIAGMPPERVIDGVRFLRPLLDVARADTRSACVELGLTPWDDPHNQDPKFTRSRVRSAFPTIIDLLGPDVVANLARTARLVASDLVALDGYAEIATCDATDADGGLLVDVLTTQPAAIRTRVLRNFARRLGVPGGALAAVHIEALDALVVAWRGQGGVSLPGGLVIRREAGRLRRDG